MQKPHFNRVAILGLGLIGSSLARALAQKKLAAHVAVFDLLKSATDYGISAGFAHSCHAHAGKAVSDADLIVFATPPSTFSSLARDVAPFIREGAIVMDVASVKRHAVSSITPHLPTHCAFVPAHPIAGSEKTGPEAGRADIFAGKRVILTPEENDVLHPATLAVANMWKAVGSKTECMPAALHDLIYAYVSHLPQMLAYSVWHCVGELPGHDAEHLRRFTRLARSDATLWADICLCNADYISEAMQSFMIFAAQIEGELAHEPDAALSEETLAADPIALLFPKVVATCLVAAVSQLQETHGVHPAHYAGAGFADMSSPAVDNPEAALAAISAYHRPLAQRLSAMLAHMQKVLVALKAADGEKLTWLLK